MAVTEKNKRTKAQQDADKRYEEKRANRTQLTGYLDDDEAALLERAAKAFGNKKAGIIGALKFWHKYKNKV